MLMKANASAPSRQEVHVEIEMTAVEARLLEDIASGLLAITDLATIDVTKRRVLEKVERAARAAVKV